MKLNSLILLCTAALVVTAASGCNLFRKSKKPKENPAIAAQLAADFQQRWIDRRTSELVAGGTEAAAARTQAEREFAERYPGLLQQRK